MLPNGFHRYSARAENLTLLADSGDFFQLVGGAEPWLLLEVRVWQRGSTSLLMDTVELRRGTGGAGGTALTEFEYGKDGPTALVAAASLPTTDVTDPGDWQFQLGWNHLQETHQGVFVPELWVPFDANDDLAVTRETTIAHTGVGVQVVWAEFSGT